MVMNAVVVKIIALLVGVPWLASAAIIGTNPPALPVTAERISKLPSEQQAAWQDHLQRSQKQLHADQQFLLDEMKRHRLSQSVPAPRGRSTPGLSLNQSGDWYARAETRRMADALVSFQTPAGGWSKLVNMTERLRPPGGQFFGDSVAVRLERDQPGRVRDWSWIGTLDNGATTTQLRFLARVIAALDADASARYRTAFLRGVDYILAAQNPNGGWPQVWPLRGGYHDAITFNDNAMINALELLQDVAAGKGDFAFVPQPVRAQAAVSVQRGIECILNTQITANGRRTVWCQQHDALTLKPASARDYEMPAQSSSESARVLMFLMGLPNPDARTSAAIESSAQWFWKTPLQDVAFKAVRNEGRKLVPSPGAGPLWARYYEIGSDRPVFADRDRTIHDRVDEISKERRDGYAWFTEAPRDALEHYARWRKTRGESDARNGQD